MQAKLDHVYIYVADRKKAYKFYQPLLTYLGYKEVINEDWGFGFMNKDSGIFFEQTTVKYAKKGYHRKNIGLNHLAFKAGSKTAVNKFCKEYLKPHKIKTLYDGPKAYPQYSPKYYAVFFEDFMRMKLELAYY